MKNKTNDKASIRPTKNEKDKKECEGLFIPFTKESLKETFPELRNLDGRFLGLFLYELYTKSNNFLGELERDVEEFIIFAKSEIGDKKCSNNYVSDPLCSYCMYLKYGYDRHYCKKYPQMGETWKGDKDGTPASIKHPASCTSWYWCIRVCPDFKHDMKK